MVTVVAAVAANTVDDTVGTRPSTVDDDALIGRVTGVDWPVEYPTVTPADVVSPESLVADVAVVTTPLRVDVID